MKNPMPIVISVSVIIGCLFLLGWPTNAATRLTDDYVELLKMADAAVEIRVLKTETAKVAQRNFPITTAVVEVLRVFKGDPLPESQIFLEYPGGTIGEVTTCVSGQPSFIPGQKAILLIAKRGDHWVVVGGDEGEAVLEVDNANPMALRACGKFKYYLRNSESLTGYELVERYDISREKLVELIKAVITTGKPVLGEVAVTQPAVSNPAIAAPPQAPRVFHAPVVNVAENPVYPCILAVLVMAVVGGLALQMRRMYRRIA